MAKSSKRARENSGENPEPPIPPATTSEDEAPRSPVWETLAMASAFVLLWVWFGAHRSAQKSGANLGVEWTAALLVALGVMALITVRRVQRFKRALEETKQQSQSRRGPVMPWMPPDRNGHN